MEQSGTFAQNVRRCAGARVALPPAACHICCAIPSRFTLSFRLARKLHRRVAEFLRAVVQLHSCADPSSQLPSVRVAEFHRDSRGRSVLARNVHRLALGAVFVAHSVVNHAVVQSALARTHPPRCPARCLLHSRYAFPVSLRHCCRFKRIHAMSTACAEGSLE